MMRFITLFAIFFLGSLLSVGAQPCSEGMSLYTLTGTGARSMCLSISQVDQEIAMTRDMIWTADGGITGYTKYLEELRGYTWLTPEEVFVRLYAFQEASRSYGQTCRVIERKLPKTFSLAGLYSESGALSLGCPDVFQFFPEGSRMDLVKYDLRVSGHDSDGVSLEHRTLASSFGGVGVDRYFDGKVHASCRISLPICRQEIVSFADEEVVSRRSSDAQTSHHSIAREWMEEILMAIRGDRVRPPVQARNLHHASAMMLDVYAQFYPEKAKPFLYSADNKIKSCQVSYKGLRDEESFHRAFDFALAQFIRDHYRESPVYSDSLLPRINMLLTQKGYDSTYRANLRLDSKNPQALGIQIAECYRAFGRIDGANAAGLSEAGEVGSYANRYYAPYNPILDMTTLTGGNTSILDWNRWQPLGVGRFIDQGGNEILGGAESFIGAEWGNVTPFALTKDQMTMHERDGHIYKTYLDPGMFPQATGSTLSQFLWNFALVARWSEHLSEQDTTQIDISPAHMGPIADYPKTFEEYQNFYAFASGGTKRSTHAINPSTGRPYTPQIVSRGDYARVIAEYWADGPTSETPPGHWISLYHRTSDSMKDKRWMGKGEPLGDLEWDIRSYFVLGGALHDAAIAAWSVKGAYDGVRPVSVIRAMASAGQSSYPEGPFYDPRGLPIISGWSEIITPEDILAGKQGENIGKVKIRAWRGPKYVNNPDLDEAGVGWILATTWWPYQRSSFVTPPFAGYVSGHSTFSHAAASVLESITGDRYFPGGMMRTEIPANKYLVFERGPSRSFELQWATYRDAASESSLSRIYGGIHPPMDDIPGREIGLQVGLQAVTRADQYFVSK